ncbi:MAG TPA: ATP-binding protein [Bacillota bacterium]|nr:ATP-binding protein [Bacillota bacterium]
MKKAMFNRSLIAYILGSLLITVIIGLVLSQFIENYWILLAMLVLQYIFFLLMLLYIFNKYIKPIDEAIHSVNQLLKGNYRSRIHIASPGQIGELGQQINALARNLSELSIQEQMHSEQLSTVIENIDTGLVLVDEKGYIHLVNRKFLTLFSKRTKDYVGYIIYDVLQHQAIQETIQDTFLYEKNIKHPLIKNIDNEQRHLEIIGAPIFDERNLLKGAVIMFYDITEFKKLEMMRKDFVANVSHELKTPITAIKGFAETLLDNHHQQQPTDHFLEIIYEESRRIQTLVEDLLMLSTLEQDDFELQLSTFRLANVLQDILPYIEKHAAQHDVSLKAHIPHHLLITADREKIKQVFINLLTNAINYTPAQGEVSLTVEDEADEIIVHIADSGIGIGQEHLPRIFERFYRVDKARSRHTGGTGLGLAIVKHIVETHRGSIEVKSEENEGTTFSIHLSKHSQVHE